MSNFIIHLSEETGAIFETSQINNGTTSAWNEDYSTFPNSTTSFFRRGGSLVNDGTNAGIFCFYFEYAQDMNYRGFRVVLCQ